MSDQNKEITEEDIYIILLNYLNDKEKSKTKKKKNIKYFIHTLIYNDE